MKYPRGVNTFRHCECVSARMLYLGSHDGEAAQLDASCQNVPPQTRVLGVLQVADAAADPVLVLHVCGSVLLVDM